MVDVTLMQLHECCVVLPFFHDSFVGGDNGQMVCLY